MSETISFPVTIAVLNRLAALANKLDKPVQDVARDVFESGLGIREVLDRWADAKAVEDCQ